MAKFKITKQDVVDVIKKRWWIMLIELAVIGVILLVDLLVKAHIEDTMALGQTRPIMKGFIHFTYTINTGAGFGMFKGNTVVLTVITAIVIVGLLAFLIIAQKESMWLRVSLLFIVGGGIGNLVDRIGLGYVRDFIQFAFWEDFAIFNIADSFVTVGVFMLVIVLIVMLVTEGKKNRKKFEAEQANAPQEHLQDPLDAPIALNPMMKSENDYTFVETQINSEDENVKEAAEADAKTETDEKSEVDDKVDKSSE